MQPAELPSPTQPAKLPRPDYRPDSLCQIYPHQHIKLYMLNPSNELVSRPIQLLYLSASRYTIELNTSCTSSIDTTDLIVTTRPTCLTALINTTTSLATKQPTSFLEIKSWWTQHDCLNQYHWLHFAKAYLSGKDFFGKLLEIWGKKNKKIDDKPTNLNSTFKTNQIKVFKLYRTLPFARNLISVCCFRFSRRLL